MAERNDIVVVGAGAIGLSCALALLEAGRGVRVIDAGRIGGGSSHGNCGTLTPSHAPPLAAPGTMLQAMKWMLRADAPLYVHPGFDPPLWRWLTRFAMRCNARDWEASARAKHALLDDSRRRIEDWVSRYGLRCQFMASGEDYVYRDRALFEHDQWEFPLLHEMGVSAVAIEGREYEAAEPAFKPGVAGAIRFSGDAMLRPDQYVAELARSVRERGGIIDEHRALIGAEFAGDGVRVATAHGALDAGQLVVAAGAWSPLLHRQLGLPWLRHTIQPGKGYSITYDRPSLTPSHPLILRGPQVCVTSWADGYRLGSTMEFSGYRDNLNEHRLGALERGAAQFLHEPVGPVVRERWYGWRPMSLDDVPLIGAVPGKQGLWLATGHGMMGIGMSAGTGQMIADLVTGKDTAVDHRPFRPERLA